MRKVAVLAALLMAMGACSAIPADPDGTLARVTGETLRVGVSPNPPWTDLPRGVQDQSTAGTDSAAPEGSEVELVAAFADFLDAEVRWVGGGEEELIAQLERGELEIVIGGLTARSPWQEQAALTTPYTETLDGAGDRVQHVMATPMGENAFLVTLEQFLLDRH